jgi:uncharacterized protein (TIRG00374 family)
LKKKFLLGLAISALCLYLIFRKIDLTEFRKSLVSVKYSYLLISVAFIFLFTFFRALRWKYLLRPLKKINTVSLFELVVIGYMANNVLPARMGEVVRALVLGKAEGISKIASLATIFMERIFDMITLFPILVIASYYLPSIGNDNHLVLLAAGIVALSGIFLLLIRYQKNWLFRASHSLVDPISPTLALKIQKSIRAFIEGFKVLEQGEHMVAISFLSGIIGLALGGIYYFVAVAFDITLSLPGLLLLLSMVFLGVLIPSSPGFIGTFHYFCIKGLFLAGVRDHSLALSYAVVVHLIQYIPESLLGMIFFWKKGLSFREIQTAEIQIE